MNDRCVLNIADIHVALTGDYPKTLLTAMKQYLCHSSEPQDIRIACKVTEHLDAIDFTEQYGTKNFIEEFGAYGEAYFSQDRDGERSYATIAYSQTFDSAECTLVDVAPLGGAGLADRFPVAIGDCFLNCLPAFDGITFHASAIAYRGEALLFAAPSGTGKSTQSSLWAKVHPNDVVYINDDTPVIKRKDSVFHAFGTPWAGTSGIQNNLSAPIKAIILVKRGTDNTLRPVDGEEKLTRLLCSAREQHFPPQRKRQTNLLFDIAAEVPMYELCCDISQKAVEAVETLLCR